MWGKLYYWVSKKDYLPADIQYYDEKGNLVREMVYSNVKKFGKRKIPSVWIMDNKSKPGNSTTISIQSIEFDINISDSKFSFEELEKGN